jgi:MoxR-like ATPase
MPWTIFTGSGKPATKNSPWESLPKPPPWRDRATAANSFIMLPGLQDAVNTALHLRRPLLLTGSPGSGKSTLVSMIAAEFGIGPVLTWHVTSRSTLDDALYEYDALARLHSAEGNRDRAEPVEQFVTLGPLGTALADASRPRAVLVDEIDKSDVDLPGDLLHVLESGEFRIPPLVRDAAKAEEPEPVYPVTGADGQPYNVPGGVVQASQLPVIVLTSNGERTFPPPFLRRCVRFEMPTPKQELLEELVARYLGEIDPERRRIIGDFAERIGKKNQNLAIDQLLSLVYLVTGEAAPGTEERKLVEKILLTELSSR